VAIKFKTEEKKDSELSASIAQLHTASFALKLPRTLAKQFYDLIYFYKGVQFK
jgi:hypothetical protein